MLNLTDLSEFLEIKSSAALLVLFGSKDCGVCQALKPRLEVMFNEHFPRITQCYIDCQQAPKICAQQTIFTLPVVRVYIAGQLIVEEVKVFGLSQLVDKVRRPYAMWTAAEK